MFSVGLPMLIAFFLWEWYHDDPIVDVRLLKNRNFGTAVFFSFTLGMVLFGSTVLIPEFLQSAWAIPRSGRGGALARRPGIDVHDAHRRPHYRDEDRSAPAHFDRLHRYGVHAISPDRHQPADRLSQHRTSAYGTVVFMPFIFIPISTLNYIGVPREKNNQVSGLSNFARNLGGSIGTSLLSTFLARQNQIRQVTFAAHTSYGDPNFVQWINGMKGVFLSQGYDTVVATDKALALAYGTVQAQATTLSFVNSFWVMALVVACLSPLPFIMRRPKPGERQTALSH